MKNKMKIVIGLIMSVMLAFSFVGCGSSNSADAAASTVDKMLSAYKGADLEAISKTAGGEDIYEIATQSFGSVEAADSVITAIFANFDYTIGTPELSDEIYANVPVTVTNVDMQQVVNDWANDVRAYSDREPNATNDREAFQAKIMEMFAESIEKAASEGSTVSNEIVFPMYLEDGEWYISKSFDDDIFDKMTGGIMTAINGVTGQ